MIISDLPEAARNVLVNVAEYRAAARRAVHADRPVRAKCLALLDLAASARRESESVVRDWIEQAIWREAAPFLTGRPASPAGDAYERAARKLRAEGYVMCPTCHSSLPDEETLDRQRLMRLEGAPVW